MPEENRFEGIGSELDELGESVESEEATESPESTEFQASKAASESGASASDMVDQEDVAAFSYEESSKTTVYGTEDTLGEYKKALSLAKARIIEDYDHDDIQDRELHNAALLVAADNVDEIAEKFSEERQ